MEELKQRVTALPSLCQLGITCSAHTGIFHIKVTNNPTFPSLWLFKHKFLPEILTANFKCHG